MDAHRALQAEPRPPPPHPAPAAQGHELVGLRRQPSPAGELDGLVHKAIAAWEAEPRTTRGGQPWYSELAILTALTLRAVFRLAYRQTEGLIGSLMGLLGLDLPVPDHTTLSRRAATLEVPRPRSSSRPNAHTR